MTGNLKGPKMGLLKALILGCLLVGYIKTESEKDFGFLDDEDMLADQAGSGGGSGDGSGDTEVGPDNVIISKPTGVPALYRVVINVTSVAYTDEIAAAGRDIASLAITQKLQQAIQQLLNSLPGTIRIRIVGLRPGSLMVTFDIDTDGQQTEEEILAMLNDVIKKGNLNGYRVSDVGFEFKPILDAVTCLPSIGREPTALPEKGEVQASLMVNFQFPCDGYVVGWRYYRANYFGETIIGVFRQISDTEFALVAKTRLPSANNVGIYTTKPDEPILVRRGYFVGILHAQNSAGGVIAYARSGSNASIPDAELYQNYLMTMYESDLVQDRPFKITDFVHSENLVTYALQAQMNYDNVSVETTPPARQCTAEEWRCNNGECVPAQYRCDTQRDCYDGSDEENCPPPSCPNGEFQCADRQQCLPTEFVCNFVSDCGDGSDELNCGPAPVIIISYRQGTNPNSFTVSWIRPQQGGSDILRYILKYRKVSVRSDTTLDGDYIVQRPLEPFNDVTIDADQDKFVINLLEAGSYYEVEMRAMNAIGESEPRSFVFKTASAGCIPGQWQCRDGGCIPLQQRCDLFPGDCADDSDEDGCADELRCSEGQVVCRLPDGTEVCRNDAIGCAVACNENQFQCLDGLKCISFGMLCDGRVDCNDNSDESNCECADGEFQCVAGRQCISGTRRCDGNNDCDDSSDEENCPCPSGTFQCLGRRSQCVTEALVCDGARDCDDGSDELNCPVTPKPGCTADQWQCADGSCIPDRMRCDSFPQCEDSSDEVNCLVPSAPYGLNVEYIGLDTLVVRISWEAPRSSNGELTQYAVSWRRTGDRNMEEAVLSSDQQSYIFRSLRTGTEYLVQVTASNVVGISEAAEIVFETPADSGCPSGQWRCADGSCIPDRMRCDGVPQCEDSSDEVNCPGARCRDDQYTCADGNCIEQQMRCDGVPQCEDSSDEDNCPCREGMFQCLDGFCIEGNMKCDGIPQCEDASDEQNCPAVNCPSSDFQCASTSLGQRIECVDKRLQCDGYVDCSDGSDESDCPGCRADEFTCVRDGSCVPGTARCNGSYECRDRSDELGCVCTADQFKCGDGLCIDLARRCNREVDCSDQSDELACPCRAGEFQCLNGECIPEQRRCDNRLDCRDRSDEQNCPRERTCPEGNFLCGTGHCLPLPRVCDGRSDCPDGSDERNCSLECAEDEIECVADNKCLTADQICNRVYDCSDGRDELNCQRCTENEFQCNSDRSCISAAGRCNGRKECSDGSDEMNCPTLPPISVEVSPKNLRIRAGAEAIIICTAQGLPQDARLEWVRRGGELPMQSAVEGAKLMIPGAKPMDSGDYVCQVVGVPGSFEDTARVEVVAVGPQPTAEPGKCGRDEAVCQNGQCIRREYRCDGEADCTDGSDEPDDCFGNLCEPNEFQCPSGQCVMKIWRCDGENDCDDGFDESNCVEKDPNEACGFDEFQCLSGDQCIPLAYQCDQEIDCLDRSDEIGCSPPVITLPPVAEIEVELGATFTIICEAVGVPMPLIVWRLNWGNIPTGERVKTTSSEGRGVLTISDARYEDAGAYTCEAINNRGSIFAIPDALVIVTLDINTPFTHEEIPIHAERLLSIGGTPDVILNAEEDLVLITQPGNCPHDLSVSLDGPKLITSCGKQRQTIELVYIGGQSVDFEIAKKVIEIPRRGDIVPEPLNDTTVVLIGGLTDAIREDVKEVEIIKNVTAASIQTKIIELHREVRQLSDTEKQVIYIGFSQGCDGNLNLKDVVDGKELHCVRNVTREFIKTEITIHGDPEGIFVEKTVTNTGPKIQVTSQERVIVQGEEPVNDGDKPQPKIDVIVDHTSEHFSNEKSEITIENKDEEHKHIATQDQINQNGIARTLLPQKENEMIIHDIIGDIFEIANSSHVNVHDGGSYVELGLGSPCLTPIEVSVVGSSIISSCQGDITNITYTGQGEADFEFVREIILLSDSRDWSKYQREDFIIVYMGKLPEHIRHKADDVISVKGIRSFTEMDVNADTDEMIHVFENSGSFRHHRNQRQIILISINRACSHQLVSTKGDKRHQVKCEIPQSEREIHTNFDFIADDQDILADDFDELEEPVFIISGSDYVHYKDSEDLVDVQFSWRCENDSYVLTSHGNTFQLMCEQMKHFVNFVYVGQQPTDLYISKLVLSELNEDKHTDFRNNHISFFVGDDVGQKFERKCMVELVGNIHNSMNKEMQISVQLSGQNMAFSNHSVSVIEIGLTRHCSGTFGVKALKDNSIIYCRQHVHDSYTTDNNDKSTLDVPDNVTEILTPEPDDEGSNLDITSAIPKRRSDILVEETEIAYGTKIDDLAQSKIAHTDLKTSTVKHGDVPDIEVVELETKIDGENLNKEQAFLPNINLEIGVESPERNIHDLKVVEIDITSHEEEIHSRKLIGLSHPKAKVEVANGDFKDFTMSPHTPMLGEVHLTTPSNMINTNFDQVIEEVPELKLENVKEAYTELIVISGDTPTDSAKENVLIVGNSGESNLHSNPKGLESTTFKSIQVDDPFVEAIQGQNLSFKLEEIKPTSTSVKELSTDLKSTLDSGRVPLTNSNNFGNHFNRSAEKFVGKRQSNDTVKGTLFGILTGASSGIIPNDVRENNKEIKENALIGETVILTGKNPVDVGTINEKGDLHTNKSIYVIGKGPVVSFTSEEIDIGPPNSSSVSLSKPANFTTEMPPVTHNLNLHIPEIYNTTEADISDLSEKIVLINTQIEYININQTDESLNIDLQDKCLNNYNVRKSNEKVLLSCTGSHFTLEISLIGARENLIEVKTTAKKVIGKPNDNDKVQLYLAGFRQPLENSMDVVILKEDSVINVNTQKNEDFLTPITEIVDGESIHIVEIGIIQDCRSGSIKKYLDQDGTVVYCTRRSDILPEIDTYYEDNHGIASGIETIERKPKAKDEGEYLQIVQGTQAPNIDDKTNIGEIIHEDLIVNSKDAENESPKLDLSNTNTEIHSISPKTEVVVLASDIEQIKPTGKEESNARSYITDVIFSGKGSATIRPPRRGDIDVEGYDENNYQNDFTDLFKLNPKGVLASKTPFRHLSDWVKEKENNQSSKNQTDTVNGHDRSDRVQDPTTGLNVIDMKLNKSIDLRTGKNCTGSIKAVETDDGVVIKGQFGGQAFQMLLANFRRQSAISQSYGMYNGYVNESPYRSEDSNGTIVVSDKISTLPLTKHRNKILTLREVYLASKKRHMKDHLKIDDGKDKHKFDKSVSEISEYSNNGRDGSTGKASGNFGLDAKMYETITVSDKEHLPDHYVLNNYNRGIDQGQKDTSEDHLTGIIDQRISSQRRDRLKDNQKSFPVASINRFSGERPMHVTGKNKYDNSGVHIQANRADNDDVNDFDGIAGERVSQFSDKYDVDVKKEGILSGMSKYDRSVSHPEAFVFHEQDYGPASRHKRYKRNSGDKQNFGDSFMKNSGHMKRTPKYIMNNDYSFSGVRYFPNSVVPRRKMTGMSGSPIPHRRIKTIKGKRLYKHANHGKYQHGSTQHRDNALKMNIDLGERPKKLAKETKLVILKGTSKHKLNEIKERVTKPAETHRDNINDITEVGVTKHIFHHEREPLFNVINSKILFSLSNMVNDSHIMNDNGVNAMRKRENWRHMPTDFNQHRGLSVHVRQKKGYTVKIDDSEMEQRQLDIVQSTSHQRIPLTGRLHSLRSTKHQSQTSEMSAFSGNMRHSNEHKKKHVDFDRHLKLHPSVSAGQMSSFNTESSPTYIKKHMSERQLPTTTFNSVNKGSHSTTDTHHVDFDMEIGTYILMGPSEVFRSDTNYALPTNFGQKGPCEPPFFNFGATTRDDCVRCFCFGQDVQCFSSDLQVSNIGMVNPVTLNSRDRTAVEDNIVSFKASTREYQVIDFSRRLRSGAYYFHLPREFLGERLTSYGGELKYTIFYDTESRRAAPTTYSDVIITGNGITLYYRARTQPNAGVPTSVSVPLIESAWERYDGTIRGDTPIAQFASREEFMTVLQNVESIQVKASYDDRQSTVRIGGIFMTTAVDYSTEFGRAYLVEECQCPTGYTGLSCQTCAAGFTRIQSGGYLGQCSPCNCNGHSNDCNTRTGECLNCQHNTFGPQCQICADGYYGDARGGTPNDCRACPCPLTDPANQFSRTCFLEADGEVTCANCPVGYEGRRCEKCSEGYRGDPLTPGSSCVKVNVEEICDSRGSLSANPDPLTRRCRCKANVMGTRCDSCQANTFHLTNSYDLGCIRCFCMGVSKSCQSTYWSRAQMGISFTRDEQDVSVTDAQGQLVDGVRLQVDANNRELMYRNPGGSDIYYWYLPARFLGDKVTAYGGSLRFTIRYNSRQGTEVDSREPFVILTGNEITLIYRQTQTVRANRPQTFNIVMYEQNWYRSDGQPATREHLLMALADLDSILIRSSFEEQQSDVGLRDVTLDIAEDRRTRQDRAYAVEQCVCPVGYKGLSCEDCDTGYTRSGGGLYLGLCEPCNCNGHSNECDPETGECRNCQHNTAGNFCDRCAVGYYGNATQGRRNDCQKCPCPLTESPNQFSPTCELAADGQVTCTACPAGHTGRRCETCITGYTGNPMKPGDYCRLGPVNDCDCDTRGTVPNTQCDKESRQCQCKPYTQGRRCARCREGYFYLESDNPQGCLTCYCSGITNQCTSSSYYRDALRPVFGNDGSHNFVLLNRRMNNIISDGFVVDASRNAITFNQFEGIQKERESLFFQLPAKFRGDRVTSYGGYLRFTLEFSARPEGRMSRDVDLEIISDGQALRLYNLFEPPLQEGKTQTYEILLRESSFNDLRSNTGPTRATFMTILSNVEGILIRATYHTAMASVTLKDVSMDTAIPTATDLGGAQMVEDCRCPEGYTGLSCQRCAQGYLRVSDGRGGLGRCVKCNCNGHASSCDPDSGRCLDCQHNTEGDRCEVCSAGYYGDATSGTPSDCRKCPCPLTTSPNQFSRTCRLAEDNKVTCDRCPTGYTGRQCEQCAQGYTGDPTQPGDSCRPVDSGERPEITVSPIRVEESLGSTAVFQCVVGGPGPFRVVWSRLDSRRLPDRASVNPRYTLTIRDLQPEDTGRYVCDASNAYGVSRGTVTLQVNSGPSPIQVRIQNPRVEIDEGRTARLVCTAVSTSREATYILSWSKQGSQMPPKAIDQNGVLIIPNIQQSDAGNYICMGSDMFTTDEEIAVLIVSDAGDQAPSVRIEPRYQTVEEGTQARFACIVTGSPTPNIEWYRGGERPMNPEANISDDGVFIIPRVAQSDESDYYCKATNSMGTTEVRTILYVKLVQQPEITVIVRRTNYLVIAGQTARLECYTDDTTGRVTIFWSRANGLPIGSSQEDGILTIPDVQKSFGGRYVCTGTDTTTGRINTVTTTLVVNVEEATEAPTVTVEPEKLTIPMGTTGTLRCVATGTPTPTVTWMKSREELAPNHQVTGNSLRITQASMSDRGIYVCRAENSAGMSQDWSMVEVERRMRPKIDIYPNTTQTTVVGGSVLFQCRVMDGDPPPTVKWSRVGGLPLSEKTTVMDNGVIMFKEVTQTEQGSYICTATNDMGTVTATVTLTVQGPPSITIQPSSVVYALIGERVTLECTAQGQPTPQVFWVEPSKVRRGDLPPDVQASYPTSEGTAILDIGSVSREDQGYYRCVASNDGGQSEENVQLVVREGDGGRTAGVRIAGPSTLSVVEGQSVELVCSAEEIPGASIRWTRREGALPPGHTVQGGILTIPQFRAEYGGEYICSTVVSAGRFEASVFIIITVAPRLNISPQRVTARAGETIILSCAASGSGPFDIEWMKVDGQMNPRATERDGTLEIRQATAADAGRYRCVVRSSSAGTSDGYAIVEIEVPPQVIVSDRNVRVSPGNNAELRCTVTGTPTPVVRWDREIGEMPAQHRVQNGVLTIYNVQPEDSGRYICTATSSAGSTRDYGVLSVDAGGVINGGVNQRDSQYVNVGDRVTMECIVTGTPLPRITWSRDGGALPRDAIVGDGVLIIPQAKVEDAGTYTCFAVNEAGSVTTKVQLFVKAEPYVTAPSATTAALGDKVSLVCEARGYPSPDITWTRKNGEMPDDYTIVDGNLLIMRVRPEDAGTYVCQAQNQYGRTETPVDLSVGDLVPYFSQDPNSYMSFKPLNDVYLDFDILLSLKPESSEGMVLYNGQFEDGGGDFVCFGLKEGYPEFRFDVGSGPAIIRGNQTLNLNQWHTIKLKRNRKQGEMVVNDRTRYTGESPGYFTGLDLTQNMYLGSVPDYNNIPQAANFKEGFVGSISEVKLKGIDLNLGAEALEIVGVEPYNSCRNTQCLNGGLCMPANNRLGRQCICKQGYTGDLCQEKGMRCHQGACGQDGRCYDLEDGSGFRCICPVGKTGAGCNMDIAIINPFFNRTSFISYPPAENALFSLTIYIEFKPYTLSDGIILYEGNSRDGTGDYMALIQKDGYLEFRFDTGSGPAIVRSRYPLRLNEWTRVTASRSSRNGTLIVNSDDPVSGASPGSTVGLNLKLPLYLGGPDPTYPVASSVGVSQGFIGCVAELTVNDKKVDLLNDAIESANIVDCGERRLCERQPCENGATCEDLPGPGYRCICPVSHTGQNCEIEINICLTNSPCRNGAPCSITDDGYRCDCPLGYVGDNCQTVVDITTAMSFVGDGFIEFDKDLLPHKNNQERQTVSFVIQTLESDGLIFWHGEPGGRPLRGGDYFAIGLRDGLVEFRYEMGSGPAVIVSNRRVDDGQPHTIAVERLGRSGSLTIDNDEDSTVFGDSKGFLQMLNAEGNIYVGGVSLIGPMTENKYSQNFKGCISDIVIHGKGPLKPRDAERGFNVEPCSG